MAGDAKPSISFAAKFSMGVQSGTAATSGRFAEQDRLHGFKQPVWRIRGLPWPAGRPECLLDDEQ
jgi:hypothetical protein